MAVIIGEILSGKLDGYVVMVDSTDENSFADSTAIISNFEQRVDAPYLIVANKADLKGALRLTDLRARLGISPIITAMPCVATQKSSCRQVLLQLVELINKSNSLE